MGSSLFAGVSGLNASSKQMDIVGNNIANINTVGFKAGVAAFGDILSQSLIGGAGEMQIGRGVGLSAIPTLFGQGSFMSTQSVTDLAIDGDGFFIVNDAEDTPYYTRAGMFTMDKTGHLVDVNGYRVQGYIYENDKCTGAIGDLSLGGIQPIPAKSTTEISIGANLNAEAALDETFVSALTVYDSLGTAHTLTLTFTKTATPGEWGIAGSGLDPASVDLVPATITFDPNGNLVATTTNIAITVTGTLPNNATIGDGGVINWNLVDDNAKIITGYASPSINRSLVSDGHRSGDLQSLSIGIDGVISGLFTNGQTADIGQIALAKFVSPWGLEKRGSNLFAWTPEAGSEVRNKPGTGGVGEISPSSLEMSNTDLATEFINMITAQRAYQANAKVITTTDQMMAELMNIKR